MVIQKKTTYRSIHTDYLQFAILSFLESKNAASKRSPNFVNRTVVESIRYAFDCIEASSQFVFQLAQIKQLPIDIPDTWLTRFLVRQWNELSVADSLGLLSFAYTGSPFWQSDEQFQLFEDLRKLRNGLTHPKPTATRSVRRGTIFTSVELLHPHALVNSKPIATFNPTPIELDQSDAEQALEILLHHLNRVQDLFFNKFDSRFCFYDQPKNDMVGTKRYLESLSCRFLKYWQ